MTGEEERAVEEEEENNTDYESDPEEVKLSLKMRRREASDDEQSADNDDDAEVLVRDIRSEIVVSDDDQGGADDYDDVNGVENEEDDDDVYYDDYDEVEVVGEEIVEYSEVEEKENGLEKAENGGTTEINGETGITLKGEGEEGEGEKKEVEPFSVPTSGAFYMHDDRFRGNVGGGRNRRTFGGRKLWESKDERKWGHDKFEELNLHDRHHDEGRRSSRGSYRGRGRARGTNGGYSRGSRVREYSENINQNAAPKDVRGRGPRRYQPLMKNNKGETHSPQYKQSGKSFDKNSYTGSGKNASRSFDKKSYTASGRMSSSTGSSNVEHELASAKKVGSNLSSASPPFYPSGASTKDVASAQKREMATGNHTRNMRPSGNPNFPMPIADTNMRGKNAIDSTDSTKTMNNLHLQSSTSSLSNPNQFGNPRGQGRVVASSRPAIFQPVQTNNLVNKISPQPTLSQSPLLAPGQQLSQRPLVASQSLSPPKAGKGGAIQGTGRGSLGYGGAHVMESGGNVGAGNGDPNMPAFYPVMQFGGQHAGGVGVPAVGMAFPGYVAQPNGLGSSEMTWLPMLASAAGALGASYCPPYLAVDNNYHSRPTGQTSALPAPSKDNNLGEFNSENKHQQRSEVANDEFSQRQNNSRRYSKMNINQ